MGALPLAVMVGVICVRLGIVDMEEQTCGGLLFCARIWRSYLIGGLQLGKKVLATIFAVWPLVRGLLGRK